MPQIIILVGLQGSGKSTWSQRFLEGKADWAYISKDLIRSNKQKKMTKKIELATSQSLNILIDNTNPSKAHRAPIIELAGKYDYTIFCYHFKINVEACVRRNETRDFKKRVPPVGLFSFLQQYENPSFEEGFNHIIDVELTETEFIEEERACPSPSLDY